MLLRPTRLHWNIWENIKMLGFSSGWLKKRYSAARRSTSCAMRQIVPKVLTFHNVSTREQAIGFENCILKCRSKSVGENSIFFCKQFSFDS